jgi:hypothetical protein
MSSDDKIQFKVYLRSSIDTGFRQFLSQRWGTINRGILSLETEQAIIQYIGGGWRLTAPAHTHPNSIKNRVRSNHIKGVRIDQKAKVSGISSPIVLVNSSGQFESKGFRNLPRNSSLIQFAAKKGGFEFEHCDFELADRLRTDAAFREQYHKETQAQLRAKALRIDNYHYRTKLQEQDRNEIRPEIRQIKQHLVNISAISDQQRVDKVQIHDAYKIITGNRDIRSFDPRLKQYMLHEYVSPLNPEETSFRVTQKFLEI